MSKIKRSTIPNVDVNVKELGLSYTPCGNVKWYTTLENGLVVSLKVERTPTICDPAILFLDISSREMKVNVHTKSCA